MTATTIPRPAVQIPTAKGRKTIMLNVEYAGCIVKINRVNDHYLVITGHTTLDTPAATQVGLYFNRTRNAWVGDYYVDNESVEIGQSPSLTEMATAAMLDVAWRGRDNGAW